MNCAVVHIQSDATSALSIPAIYEANIFGEGGCLTPEREMIFPNPGDSVEYKGSWTGQTPSPDLTLAPGCEAQAKRVDVTLKPGKSPTQEQISAVSNLKAQDYEPALAGAGSPPPAPPPSPEEEAASCDTNGIICAASPHAFHICSISKTVAIPLCALISDSGYC